jgi:uncharacterized protein
MYPMTQPNQLVHETSPYLRQHAHNPVDWYPWSEEALQRARDLKRPIFLSIGYSACHWCHVMEHESFEDPEVARLLNEHFVSIKVDREERPDLDQIYMTAVQMLTGQGGWPMSMFLTPELKPFFGGTYFPPVNSHGRPSFKRVLEALIDAWQNKRGELDQQAEEVTAGLRQHMQLEAGTGELSPHLLQNAGNVLRRAFDRQYGGFGQAPKFPHPMDLRLLLRVWKRFGDDGALDMVRKSLDQMARGGIYDHLGGGFARYSTDARWLVPHFEKMLYDNALLTLAYLEAYQATGVPFYRTVVEETLAYVQREMTGPDGAFYSTQDADSEGVEGKFYVWSRAEIESVLGPDEARLFCDVYDVTEAGNWDGHNILHRTRTDDQEARLLKIPEDELRRRLRVGKEKLFETRSRRIWPARDEKILTAWNALMIAAFAKAAQVLEEPAYARAARRAADYLLTRMLTPEGRLYRTTFAGAAPKLNGYLEDYAYLIDALVSLYEATFEPAWITAANRLAGVMLEQFWDEKEHGFFYTGHDHEQLIARGKDPHDNATPSGNAMAVTALLRLVALTGAAVARQRAEETLALFRGIMAETPTAAAQMLIALDFYLGPTREVVVIGAAAECQEALRLLRGPFRPHQVVAWKAPDEQTALPLLADRTARGAVTTYICENFVCQAPLVGVPALAEALLKE